MFFSVSVRCCQSVIGLQRKLLLIICSLWVFDRTFDPLVAYWLLAVSYKYKRDLEHKSFDSLNISFTLSSNT